MQCMLQLYRGSEKHHLSHLLSSLIIMVMNLLNFQGQEDTVLF